MPLRRVRTSPVCSGWILGWGNRGYGGHGARWRGAHFRRVSGVFPVPPPPSIASPADGGSGVGTGGVAGSVSSPCHPGSGAHSSLPAWCGGRVPGAPGGCMLTQAPHARRGSGPGSRPTPAAALLCDHRGASGFLHLQREGRGSSRTWRAAPWHERVSLSTGLSQGPSLCKSPRIGGGAPILRPLPRHSRDGLRSCWGRREEGSRTGQRAGSVVQGPCHYGV